MSVLRLRSLPVGPLRAFEALSRTLNFRVTGEELHLTQPAISRQIKLLEEQVGTVLFVRDKRRVELTAGGATLLQAVGPWLARLDLAVRQIRQTEGRRVVGISTFTSMASLWLIPRLVSFRRRHAIDVRVLVQEQVLPLDGGGAGPMDVVLRHCRPADAPAGAVRLFDDVLMPVASPALLERSRKSGGGLRHPRDLARQTLIEDLDLLPSAEYRSWYYWLRRQNLSDLHPKQWLYFNLAHLQVQAALAEEGIALGRLPLVVDQLGAGDLVEPFASLAGTRLQSPYAYWLITPSVAADSKQVQTLQKWILAEASATRGAMAAYLSARVPQGDGRRATRASARQF